jgi:hypothetical protein
MISGANYLQLVEGNRLVNWISFIQPFFQWSRPQDGFECTEFDFGLARVLGTITMMFCLVRSYLGGNPRYGQTMPNPKRDIIVSNIPIGTEDRTFVVFPSLHHEEDVAHGMSLPTQNQEPYFFFYFFCW